MYTSAQAAAFWLLAKVHVGRASTSYLIYSDIFTAVPLRQCKCVFGQATCRSGRSCSPIATRMGSDRSRRGTTFTDARAGHCGPTIRRHEALPAREA